MPPKRSNLSPRTCDGKRQRTARGKQSAGPSQIAEEQPSRTTKVVAWLKAAFHYDRNKPYNTNPKVTIGRMNNVCKYCGAKKWQVETPGMCCNGGKVKLEVICANNRPMGGITVLLSGDFRQTLPIITRGTRADEINACIKSSYLWSKFQRLSLSTNIRVQLYSDGEAGQFASQLLQVGDGQLPAASVDKQVILPFGQSVDNEDALTTKVFPNLAENYRDRTWLSERAISWHLKMMRLTPSMPNFCTCCLERAEIINLWTQCLIPNKSSTIPLRSSIDFNQQELRLITYFLKSVHQSSYSETLIHL